MAFGRSIGHKSPDPFTMHSTPTNVAGGQFGRNTIGAITMYRTYVLIPGLSCLLGLFSGLCLAEQTPPVQEEPPLFPPEQGSLMEEPAVVIRDEQNLTIKEYRIKGQLYMIEIQPSKGRPYYLLDLDGDGRMESRRGELGRNFVVPSWVILRW